MSNATAPPVTIAEFVLARVSEDEAAAQVAADTATNALWWSALETADDAENFGSIYASATNNWADAQTVADWYKTGAGEHISRHDPARVLAECAAKRAIIEFHKQWPILVEGPTKFDSDSSNGLDTLSVKMSRQIMWATEQEYRNRFGDEPPTTPMMRALASVYSDHPDYREEWAL